MTFLIVLFIVCGRWKYKQKRLCFKGRVSYQLVALALSHALQNSYLDRIFSSALKVSNYAPMVYIARFPIETWFNVELQSSKLMLRYFPTTIYLIYSENYFKYLIICTYHNLKPQKI